MLSKKKGEGRLRGKRRREERGEREGGGANACRRRAHLLEIEEEGKY